MMRPVRFWRWSLWIAVGVGGWAVVPCALLHSADREQGAGDVQRAGAEPQRQAPPRFAWSPVQGYVFVEGNCGEGDQILGWMAPPSPRSLRDSRLIMFFGGNKWAAQFEETSGHFIARWRELRGREVVVVPGDHGRPRNEPIRVRVPWATPYGEGTLDEAMYLQGYAGGVMDSLNSSPWSSPTVDGARGKGWVAGRKATEVRRFRVLENRHAGGAFEAR